MLLTLLLLALPPAAASIEARDSRGLAVVVESIAEPMSVNGLPVHVARAHGPEVPILAQRIAERWRTEQSIAQQIRHREWHILGRWNGTRSEVLQWRGEGVGAELLLSWFDTTHRPRAPTVPPLELPFQCTWTRTVEGEAQGRRYSQHLARCGAAPDRVTSMLQAALARQDWSVLHHRGHEWDVARQRHGARVAVVPGDTPAESAVIWISMPEGGFP
jgi:hypothetical protein